jgi:hypothetical protein
MPLVRQQATVLKPPNHPAGSPVDSLRTAGVYPTKVNLSIIALTPLKRHGSAQSFTVPLYANQGISRRSRLISDGASPPPETIDNRRLNCRKPHIA